MTNWIQTLASIAAIFVAYWSYRVSKSVLTINKEQMDVNKEQYDLSKATLELSKQISYASHRCIIYPEKVNLVNNSYWQITLRNNGIGIAFNVEVQMHLRSRLENDAEPVPMTTNGSKVINPQSDQSYVTVESGLSLLIFKETPIIIRWEEMSGLKNEAQWYWSANAHGDEKFSLKKHIRKEDSN